MRQESKRACNYVRQPSLYIHTCATPRLGMHHQKRSLTGMARHTAAAHSAAAFTASILHSVHSSEDRRGTTDAIATYRDLTDRQGLPTAWQVFWLGVTCIELSEAFSQQAINEHNSHEQPHALLSSLNVNTKDLDIAPFHKSAQTWKCVRRRKHVQFCSMNPTCEFDTWRPTLGKNREARILFTAGPSQTPPPSVATRKTSPPLQR